jgi:hypothetical protein
MAHGNSTIKLEEAVEDAALMARLPVEFLGRGLGFDNRTPPQMDDSDRDLLRFAVTQTMVMAEQARTAFRILKGDDPIEVEAA